MLSVATYSQSEVTTWPIYQVQVGNIIDNEIYSDSPVQAQFYIDENASYIVIKYANNKSDYFKTYDVVAEEDRESAYIGGILRYSDGLYYDWMLHYIKETHTLSFIIFINTGHYLRYYLRN